MLMRVMTLLSVALLAAGCGGSDEEDALEGATTALTDTAGAEDTLEEVATQVEEEIQEAAVTLDLQEQNASGITGTVTLSPDSDGAIEVQIELDGSDGEPRPAHIHEGTCAELDPNPAFPLEDVVDGRSSTEVEAELSELTLNEYAVNVHESAENASTYVACADLRNQ